NAMTGEYAMLKRFGITSKQSNKDNTVLFRWTDLQTQKDMSVRLKRDDKKGIQTWLQTILEKKFKDGMKTRSEAWSGLLSALWETVKKFQVAVMKSGPFEKMRVKLVDFIGLLEKWDSDGTLKH